jgi:hypothetical protein
MEIAVKVLHGFNDFWVYYGGLTDVAYTITVTDTNTTKTKTYTNAAGSVGGGRDVTFSATSPVIASGTPPTPTWAPSVAPGACVPDAFTLCITPPLQVPLCPPGTAPGSSCSLPPHTFKVTVKWTTPSTNPPASGVGVGGMFPQSTQSGDFTFFGGDNMEIMAKIFDGRSVNSRYWFYTGALSDVDYVITITDVNTGKTLTVHNPNGNYSGLANSDMLGTP